jgi:zinc/manganese transport system permease protein
MQIWRDLIPVGFFLNPEVTSALAIATAVAVACAVTGVFVIVRGQSFLGHALGDVGSTGAAGAYLAGVTALFGFLAAGLVSGVAMDSLGRRAQERDVATGVVLSFMLGLSSLFLYLISATTSRSGAPIAILFGSVFTVNPALEPYVFTLTALAVLLTTGLYRPLLLASTAPDVARARGVPVRLVGLVFVLALVIAVEEAALVVGALLSTALVIGPASAAVRLTRRVGSALVLAVVFGIGIVWLGTILAYDSYLWPPVNRGWPVSFFVASLALLTYLGARLATRSRDRKGLSAWSAHRSRTPAPDHSTTEPETRWLEG